MRSTQNTMSGTSAHCRTIPGNPVTMLVQMLATGSPPPNP